MSETAQGLRYPAETDSPDVPRDIQNLAKDVDIKFTRYEEGTHAARPAPAHVNRLYYETDTGALFKDTGSEWMAVGRNTSTDQYNSSLTPWTHEEVHEPSTTRGTMVTTQMQAYPSGAGEVQLHCTAEVNSGGLGWQPVGDFWLHAPTGATGLPMHANTTFYVPPKGKWRVKIEGGNGKEAQMFAKRVYSIAVGA